MLISGAVQSFCFGFRNVARSDHQNAEAVFVVVVRHRQHGVTALIVEGDNLAILFHVGGDAQHLLHGAFAHQQMIALAVFHHNRQATAHEVERHLIDFAVPLRLHKARLIFREVNDRLIHQVFDAALIVAVEPGQRQHGLIFLTVRVDVVLKDDFILRQGAGFVGAQHVHRAQVLNRVKALNHDFTLRHGHRALGEVGADDHWQHFWRQAYGDGQSKQQGIPPFALHQAVNQEHHRHHH